MKALIFDLDGTLLDTLQDLWASVNHALARFALPLRSLCEIRQFLGNGVGALVHQALPEGSADALEAAVLAEFRRHYLQHSLDTTSPYPGIMPMLRACKQQGFSTAIVSNKLDAAVQELHQRFFADVIDVAIGEQQPLVRRKPAPDMVRMALQRLDTSAGDAVYIGDSEVDLATARNAGLPCISVSWGFRDRDTLLAQGATCIIDRPDQLFSHLVTT